MAIKWKIFSRRTLSKLAAYVLFMLCFSLITSSALDIYLNVEDYESIPVKDYMKSNTLSDDLRYTANRLEYLLRVYKSKLNIISGGTVENLKIEDSWQLNNLYNNFIAENNLEDNSKSKVLFWSEKKDEINEIKKVIIKSDLSNYEQVIYDLNDSKGIVYYATDGKNVCSNTGKSDMNFYLSQKANLVISKDKIEITPNNGEDTYSPSLVDRFEAIQEGSDKMNIYVGITDDGLEAKVDKWNNDRHILIKNMIIIFACFCVMLACLIFLIVVTGKKFEDETIHTMFIDKLYNDVNIFIMIAITASCIRGFNSALNIRYTSLYLMKFVIIFGLSLLSGAFTFLFLSLVRHIKKGTFISYTVIYILLSKLVRIIVKIFTAGPLMLKSLFAVLLLILCTYFSAEYYPMLIVLLFIISAFIIYKKVKAFNIIEEGIRSAKEGDYEIKIKLKKNNGEFSRLAEDINTITDGLKIAVENEVKSEKLKTELITNVSHDIKTPLTSIISYVDLLKREGLNSPNAGRYINVLDRKSSRLKTLTEDLFEAAKATSGNLTVNFQKVNVNALVSQILGELNEKIHESDLKFKVTADDEKILARADGRLLSRVMENLLSNIFKYALKESRVYIDIKQTEKEVFICFKNVSANELNIPVDELMERFIRGDESRNSEGNGLGLAIAKSLMEIQKGVLNIDIDGDLFKAQIKLDRYDV